MIATKHKINSSYMNNIYSSSALFHNAQCFLPNAKKHERRKNTKKKINRFPHLFILANKLHDDNLHLKHSRRHISALSWCYRNKRIKWKKKRIK